MNRIPILLSDDLPIPPVDGGPSSYYERRLKRAQSFLDACRLAAAHYRATGARLHTLCTAEGFPHNEQFWYACAEEAEDVAELIETLQEQHPIDWKPRVLDVLRRAGLCYYFYALEEDTPAAYVEYLGF